jgi:hypothetical protein
MSDATRALVMAYDATHALGDLEDATEREIDAIYSRMIEVAFPQAASRTALMLSLVRRAIESAQANSTSSDSPPGALPPTLSSPVSPSGKSGSSTGRRKSA